MRTMIKDYSAGGYDVYILTKTAEGVELDLDIINKVGYKEAFNDYLLAVINSLPELTDNNGMSNFHHVKILPTGDQTTMLSLGVEESMVLPSNIIMLSVPTTINE